MNPTIQFQQLPLGARFEFRGRRYQKLALSLACDDEDRCGNVFMDQTQVCWDRRPGEELLPVRPPAPPHITPRSPIDGEVNTWRLPQRPQPGNLKTR